MTKETLKKAMLIQDNIDECKYCIKTSKGIISDLTKAEDSRKLIQEIVSALQKLPANDILDTVKENLCDYYSDVVDKYETRMELLEKQFNTL